jgi:hypothetical protein
MKPYIENMNVLKTFTSITITIAVFFVTQGIAQTPGLSFTPGDQRVDENTKPCAFLQ